MTDAADASISAAEAFAAFEGFPEVDVGDIIRAGLVVVAPHPDDESLGCGGTIAACRAAGIAVRVVVVSDGAGSHPNSQEYPPERLAALRRDELLAAVSCLGVAPAEVQFLELPDRLVPTGGAEADMACEALVRACDGMDAIAVTWRHDPHADHKASCALVHRASSALPAVTLWEYSIWGLTLPGDLRIDGPRPSGVKVRVGEHLEAKRAAIRAHASQTTLLINDDPKGFRLIPEMLARFDEPFETLIRSFS